jgi:ribosomal protein S18 acetylase RimI-like enzyme
MYLAGRPAAIEEVSGLTVIPARASFRHARQLLVEWTSHFHPQLPELLMLNLEDPQTDALIALKDGTPVAFVAVLPVGEIGCIEDIFVSAPFRGQGIGRTMMSRALEICARSLFKHVFLSCESTNAPAISLYHKVGFERIGAYTTYRAPQARP